MKITIILITLIICSTVAYCVTFENRQTERYKKHLRENNDLKDRNKDLIDRNGSLISVVDKKTTEISELKLEKLKIERKLKECEVKHG